MEKPEVFEIQILRLSDTQEKLNQLSIILPLSSGSPVWRDDTLHFRDRIK